MEILHLTPGGVAGRRDVEDATLWNLDKGRKDGDESEDEDDDSSYSSPESEDDESLCYNDMEDECVTDLKGNRIISGKDWDGNQTDNVLQKMCSRWSPTVY